MSEHVLEAVPKSVVFLQETMVTFIKQQDKLEARVSALEHTLADLATALDYEQLIEPEPYPQEDE